jgi:hypothetical protein
LLDIRWAGVAVIQLSTLRERGGDDLLNPERYVTRDDLGGLRAQVATESLELGGEDEHVRVIQL